MVFIIFGFSGYGQEKVLTIKPSGDTELNSQLIRKTAGAYKDPLKMKKSLDRLLSVLRSRGYLAASVDSLISEEDTVEAFLSFGKHYKFGKITVEGAYPEFLSSLIQEATENKRSLDIKKFGAWQTKVLRKMVNSGYPFASLQGESYTFDHDTIDAVFKIQPGNRYVIDTIYTKGDLEVNDRFLYNHLDIYPGMYYDESRLNTISEKLDQLPFITQIKEFELEFSDQNKVNLYLYLGKNQGNQADGLVGFVPAEGNKIRFTGRVDLLLQNSFHQGEKISVNWRALEEKSQELNLKMRYPFLFFQKVGLNTDFSLYKQDTTFLNTHLRIGFPVHIDAYQSIGITGNFDRSAVLAEQSINRDFSEYNKQLFGLNYNYTRLDHPLNPAKGNQFRLSLSVGKTKNEVFDKTLNEEVVKESTHSEIVMNAAIFRPIRENWVIKIANFSGWMRKYESSQNYFENELYRFGGTKYLRGFRENSFLASFYSLVNLELRYLFSGSSNLFIFGDGGYYLKQSKKATDDFPLGFGLGTNLHTGAGILKLSYAVGRQFNNPLEFQNAVVHISFISTF